MPKVNDPRQLELTMTVQVRIDNAIRALLDARKQVQELNEAFDRRAA